MARPALFTLAIAAVLLLWNNAVQATAWAGTLYVPLNLTAAVMLVLVARMTGFSRRELGFSPQQWRSGLRWGLGAAAVVAAVLGVALGVPGLNPLLEDGRYEGLEAPGLLYLAFVRIPLGTALWEEVAFRGVLFGVWERWRGPVSAAIGSSVVFGLWHVRPTIGLAVANDIEGVLGIVAVTVGGVIVTTVAGLIFVALRTRSGSVLAPIIAHTSTNSFALGASAFAGNAG